MGGLALGSVSPAGRDLTFQVKVYGQGKKNQESNDMKEKNKGKNFDTGTGFFCLKGLTFLVNPSDTQKKVA
ncbi:hypothetical protein LZ24_01717 [Desulfobotulus alkaliphilus]|uniref:Uncharacterized protein n=1 Tax=Desulfobotulus alkaliphilus TaxID=622671 RepID=A0A562RTA6_9BACT|nr:hypothetical protein LZ24_01717 [Desulfobotulus alkaliphilus]